MKRAPRGFTLLELVVASSVALLVFAAVAEALIHADNFRRLAQGRATLEREANLATSWLMRDVYAAGIAAGTGARIGAASSTYSTLRPPLMPFSTAERASPASAVLAAASNANKKIVLLADVARPDTVLDGVSGLTADDTIATELAPINELSGQCNADNSDATRCPQGRLGSLVAANCSGLGDLACPWSLRKYATTGGATIAGATALQIIYPDGRYEDVVMTGFNASAPMRITTAARTGGSVIAPFAIGRVVQMDAIGYRINETDRTLERRQCWGNMTPEASGFANFDGTPTSCTSGSDTGWLVIARNVDPNNSAFEYFSAAGVATTIPRDVRSVQLRLRLLTTVSAGSSKRPTELVVQRRFRMRSIEM